MRSLDVEIIAEYLTAWLSEDETRTIVKCAEISGVSLMTVKNILYYRKGRRKPNPSLKTITALLGTVGKRPTVSEIE